MNHLLTQPRVVIIGAGFAGLTATRRLAGKAVHVRLIDRNNFHLFQPLLYQVATAGLEPEQIAKPVRAILRGQSNLTFQMGQVEKVDLEAEQVYVGDEPVEYDYLIIAVGAETSYFGKDEIEQKSMSLKELRDGIQIRNHILKQFERAAVEQDPQMRASLLTFVVVGGGPTGVEMAGALSELIHLVLLKDYPELSEEQVKLLLVEARDQLLPGFPSSLSLKAKKELERKRVQLKLSTAVTSFDNGRVEMDSGELVATSTLIWSAGVQANSLVQGLGLPLGHAGRVVVSDRLQLPGYPHVYVVGDAAFPELGGEPLPMMAPVAIQMAELAVDNILREIRGESVRSFEYQNPGSLATIGRNAAVAEIGEFRFSGFLAWLVWLVVHLIQLIGFRNRIFVLINWAWDYFFYDRAVRLITELPEADN